MARRDEVRERGGGMGVGGKKGNNLFGKGRVGASTGCTAVMSSWNDVKQAVVLETQNKLQLGK